MNNKFTVFAEDHNVPLNAWSTLQERLFRIDIPKLTDGKIQLDNMLLFSKDFVIWGANEAQFEAAANYFIDEIEKKQSLLAEAAEVQRDELEEFKKMIDELDSTDLKNKTNEELYQIYDRIYEKFVQTWRDGFVILLLEMGSVVYSEIVKKKIYPKLQNIDFDHPDVAFSRILTPNKRTYLKRENIAVLEFMKKIQESKEDAELFRLADKIQDLPEGLNTELTKLSSDFGWLQFYYLGPSAPPNYYFDLVKRRLDANASKELLGIKKEEQELLFFQNAVKGQFTAAEWAELESLKEFSYLKELRKEIHQYYQNSVMAKWYKEVGKRFYLSYLQTRYILHDEFKILLVDGKNVVDADRLNERYRCCAYILEDGKVTLLSGEEAVKARGKIEEKDYSKVNESEIKGSVAFPGIARGTVKIVNSTADLAKFNEGDILLSFSTNPSLVPAMNKAAAIVTDSGGVTCHAAIVARELRIPCIIGTGYATKVLKDGDEVVVDASKGIIIVER